MTVMNNNTGSLIIKPKSPTKYKVEFNGYKFTVSSPKNYKQRKLSFFDKFSSEYKLIKENAPKIAERRASEEDKDALYVAMYSLRLLDHFGAGIAEGILEK